MSNSLPEEMYKVKKVSQSYFNSLLKSRGLTSSHVQFIMLLRSGAATQKELSERAECDKSHTNRTIAKLLHKQLIEYTETGHLKNCKIKLTEQGIRLADHLSREYDGWKGNLLKNICKEELEQVAATISKMLQNALNHHQHHIPIQ